MSGRTVTAHRRRLRRAEGFSDLEESSHVPGDSVNDAPSSAATRPNGRLRLPRNRKSSPWTRRLLVISVIVVVLLTPLWLDPWTLHELFGGDFGPAATPLHSASARPSPVAP